MERVELEVVVFVEPRAGEIVEAESGTTRERQRVEHELSDGLFAMGVRFIVEDMDRTVPNLKNMDMPCGAWTLLEPNFP